MRKTWFVLFLVALLIPSLTRLSATNADASKGTPTDAGSWQTTLIGLPNYDVRHQLAEIQALSGAKSPLADARLQARVTAIENFRARLAPEAREHLRYEMNEAGVPKMFFNLSQPLSESSFGSADELARSFLRDHNPIFGLTSREVRNLKLGNEDNDQGTTFLNYNQMINGVAVFQGQMQIAVNSVGQVMSVMAGQVVPNGKVDTNPTIPEADALATAFKYAGRQAPESFDLIEGRSASNDSARFRNPLGSNFDDVLSSLCVMRVGDEGVLAWHIYVDAGSSEWYEICLDATSGALLLRYNLYADVAQGTVARRDPISTPRTLESFVGDTTINTAAGWMGTSTVSTGNNVEAYLDTDANNTPDNNNTTGLSNGHASSSTQNFTFPFTLGVDPRTQRPASVTNLFYFCNIMHDFVYRLGFT